MGGKILTTPKGVAHYPFLTEPFVQFDPDGVYKITVELTKGDEDVEAFIAKIEDSSKDMKQRPFSVDDDTGNYMVKISSKYKPSVFDAANNHIGDGVIVGAGSEVVAAFQPAVYDGFGGGIKLYLKAVQVHSLIERTGANADSYGFNEVKGGYTLPDDGFDSVVEEGKDGESGGLDW